MTCKAHKVTGEKNKASAFQTEVSASPHSPLPLISNTVDGAHDVRENHSPIYDQKKVDEQGNANKERKRRQILRGPPEGFENMPKLFIFSPWLHCYTDFLSFSPKKNQKTTLWPMSHHPAGVWESCDITPRPLANLSRTGTRMGEDEWQAFPVEGWTRQIKNKV